MKRRALLLAAGGASVAGCQSLLPGDGDRLRLGVVDVVNHAEREQTVRMEVLAADESVHETTVTLEAAEPNQPTGVVVEKGWPDEATSYVVRVDTADDRDSTAIRLEESYTETCEPVSVAVRSDRLSIARGTSGSCYGSADRT